MIMSNGMPLEVTALLMILGTVRAGARTAYGDGSGTVDWVTATAAGTSAAE